MELANFWAKNRQFWHKNFKLSGHADRRVVPLWVVQIKGMFKVEGHCREHSLTS